jgi:flagellar assembly protein FliH
LQVEPRPEPQGQAAVAGWREEPTDAETGLGFRPEFSAATQESFLRLLTREEREELYQLVERDVAAAMGAQQEAVAARQREESRRLLADLAEKIARENTETNGVLAREAVDLALEIARRILRRQLAADPHAIVRALEVLLLKLAGTAALRVTVNPADAVVLRDQPEILARLHVTSLEEDRRIERGGCLVRADQQEWDATLAGELAALEEAITASLEGSVGAAGAREEESGDAQPRALA